jgi:predicted Zn-ribbon and HTH transcriptional regulator
VSNYESFLNAKRLMDRGNSSSQLPPIFILCDTCRWCATYFDKTRIPRGNICPQCRANNNELTSFPIMSNESFTFIYDGKRGVELEFKPRLKDS